jgi:hypothetical protein
MKVWVMQGSYEGDLFSSVHLTQKGCALACIDDILQFHGVEDEETALSVMNSCYAYTETDGEQTEAIECENKSATVWMMMRLRNESKMNQSPVIPMRI